VSHRLVVGIDGSPHSAAALRWAVNDAAQQVDAEVTAVLAWQEPFVSIPGAFDRDELEQAYKTFVVQTINEIVPSPPVPLTSLVAEGDPIESLIQAAEGADLLVLGSKGRSTFRGLMLGSVAAACAAHSPCPVVLVREGDAPGPRPSHLPPRGRGRRAPLG
jgi:nucleotide-binding universal stress UspA family protein